LGKREDPKAERRSVPEGGIYLILPDDARWGAD